MRHTSNFTFQGHDVIFWQGKEHWWTFIISCNNSLVWGNLFVSMNSSHTPPSGLANRLENSCVNRRSNPALKGLCHQDNAVLGQCCAIVISYPWTNCSYKVMMNISNKFHQEALIIITFWSFCAHNIKTWKNWPTSIHVHPCHPYQQTTGNSFNA